MGWGGGDGNGAVHSGNHETSEAGRLRHDGHVGLIMTITKQAGPALGERGNG